jgi:plastocyanin
MRASVLLLVAALAATLAPLPLAQATGFTVTASNFTWTPSSLTVSVGDTVTFTNSGGSHSWVSDSGLGSCSLPCGPQTYSTAGVFNYHCGVHPSSMRGSITVVTPTTIAILAPTADEGLLGTYDVHGTASNAGSTIASVVVRIDGGAARSASTTPSGTGVDWSLALDTTTLANGAHALAATATAANGAARSASVSFRVVNPPTIDIVALALTSTTPLTGEPRMTATFHNAGNTPTGTFHVRFEYDRAGTWTAIGEAGSASVAGFANGSASLTWTGGLHIGRYDVRAILDDRGEVEETDESNGVATGTAAWYTALVPGTDPVG